MALDKQVVGVTFTQGLDTQSDKRIVLPGKMVALQNATMSEADTFKRRNGNTIIATAAALQGLQLHDGELVALGGNTAYGYSSAGNALVTRGGLTYATIARKPVVHNSGAQWYPDAATSGVYTCYVWTDYTAAAAFSATKYMLMDEATGTIVAGPTSIDTNNNGPARVVAITGAFLLFYGAAGNNLACRVIQTSSPTSIGVATNLVTDYNHGALDVIGEGAAGYVYYVSSVASLNASQAFSVTQTAGTPAVAAGPLVVTTNAQTARGGISGVALASFGGGKLAACALVTTGSAGAGMWSAVLDTAMTISAAAALKDATAAPTVGGWGGITAVLNGATMYVYSDDAGRSGAAAATSPIRRTGVDNTNAITSAAATWALSAVRTNGTNGPFIVAKAFLSGGVVYLPLYVREEGTGTLQNTWLLYNDSAAPVAIALIAKWGPRTAGNASTVLPSTLGLSATQFGVPTGEVEILSITSGTPISVVGLSRLDVSFPANSPIHAQVGGQTFSASGLPTAYDGAAPCEADFLFFPEAITVADAGAGNIPDGTYFYAAMEEWYDNSGQRHQSAPSLAVPFTVAGGPKNNTVTIPTLFVTRRTGINIVILRSAKNSTVLQRANAINAPVANSASAATATYTDDRTDAQLGEFLYTTGGILPNNAPPPCSALAVHQDRIFINVSDDPFAFQYSQPWVNGFGVQWNENLRGRVESTGGPITGFASMDDKLIVFRPRRIGVLFGLGPSTTGAQNGYNLQDLPVDVGCSEPRSILVMPEGVIFKSTSKGWYVLGRDLQLRWIGEGVQAYDGQGVTSAVLMDTMKECRFTTNDAKGKTLRYAYDRKGRDGSGQWSTDSYAFQQVDGVWWPGGNAYVWASSTGLIKELPPTAAGYTFGDYAAGQTAGNGGTAPEPNTGIAVPLVFQTGWLKPGDVLQGFQRVWRVLFTGDVTGYPQPGTTLVVGVSAGDTILQVWDTSVFVADQALGRGLGVGLATVNYETTDPYVILDATHLQVGLPLANAHAGGATVRGSRVFGARGTLRADFYFDGNSTTIGFTTTFTDLSALVNGDAWEARIHMAIQKCESFSVKVTQTPPSIPAQSAGYVDPGGGLVFSGMTMELGYKRGARKLPAAKSG